MPSEYTPYQFDKAGEAPRRAEKRTAKMFGGILTPASGAFQSFKGDVQLDDAVIEVKHTEKAQMTIKRRWLEKVFEEALSAGKLPALVIDFASMPRGVPAQWVLLPCDVFKEIVADRRTNDE